MSRIVVGVDGSAPSLAALHWAVDEARQRHATVEVLHSWMIPTSDPYVPIAMSPETFRAGAQHVLNEALADLDVPLGDPVITTNVIQGSAVRALVDASEGADLLVVGSHGHSGIAGVLLGSVTQRVLHHSHCPVVVVRDSPVPAGAAR